MERHSNNRPKQLNCCISCSPCQLQVLTSSHGPARQVASSKYGNTPSQWVALGAEPCWVAIRDTNLERAKLCSLPPSEREGAPGSQGERGRERTAWRKGESERDKERERARGGRSWGESISAYIGAFQPTWVELGSCSALLVKSSNSSLEHPWRWVQPGH